MWQTLNIHFNAYSPTTVHFSYTNQWYQLNNRRQQQKHQHCRQCQITVNSDEVGRAHTKRSDIEREI